MMAVAASETRRVIMDSFPPQDRTHLRELAKRLAELAAQPCMAQRLAQWKQHNRLDPGRPMMLIWPQGAWRELLPSQSMVCQSAEARALERSMRWTIYTEEHWQTDEPVTAVLHVPKVAKETGWGLNIEHEPSADATGAWRFKPVLKDRRDLEKMRVPQVTYDEAATQRRLAFYGELLGDILDVRLQGCYPGNIHLMRHLTELHGLTETMMDMAADPDFVHEAMTFFADAHESRIRQYEALGLLGFNHERSRVTSGGTGYTDQLPLADAAPDHARPCDTWGSAESQEMAQVSPAMHDEFALQYEARLMKPFALVGYGCCEDLTAKLPQVFARLPNLRRVSVCPWADVGRCAEQIGRRCILSWKPRPTMLVGRFDEDAVRAHITDALEQSRGCNMEMTLKDTHTCEHQPQRFDAWSRVARQCIEAHCARHG